LTSPWNDNVASPNVMGAIDTGIAVPMFAAIHRGKPRGRAGPEPVAATAVSVRSSAPVTRQR
jgi:hypothetical protein